MYVIIVTE